MRKWLTLLIVMLIASIALVACGGGDEEAETEDAATEEEATDEQTAESGDTFSIGATQIVEHPSLDRAFEGFKDALEEAGLNVDIQHESAQGDQNNINPIVEGFVNDDVDLIFANSTPSAVGALNVTKDIPIVFTSVTDAVSAELVEAMDKPGDNITGVVDLHPDSIRQTIEFMEEYFPDSEVGVIYNAGEPNSVVQIEIIEEVVEGTSLTIAERTVSNSSEVQQAAMTLAGDVDLFFIFTDNTVVSALESIVGVANEQQIPLFVGESDSLAKGGFATYGFDYYTIGYRTGEMAVDILTGEKAPNEIEVEYPSSDVDLMINKEAAELQGVDWVDEWDDLAEFVETE